jgi:major membrane immunogen (membrane-anchored lipoprotein)
MYTITANTALTDHGWLNHVKVTIIDGKIDHVTTYQDDADTAQFGYSCAGFASCSV